MTAKLVPGFRLDEEGKRFRVEQCFGTLKRRFRCSRATYFERDKVESQLFMKALCYNLLKALNLCAL